MAKIFLGIALAVMLVTAVFGFLAKGNADKLKTTLKDTQQTLTTTQSTLSVTKGELKTRTDELTTANGKIEEQTKEIATQKGQMDDLTQKVAAAAKDIEDKTTVIAGLEKKIASMTPTVPGAIGEKDPLIEAMKAEVEKAKAEVAESKALIDSLTAKKKEVEDKMASLEKYKKDRELGFVRQGTTGRILAVNGGWNFVVLSIGDKQGAVMNATMLVLRGGEPIAKARISSVEASQSIADILPGSVRRGVTVQPGDTVVFEGTRAGGAGAAQPTAGLPVH